MAQFWQKLEEIKQTTILNQEFRINASQITKSLPLVFPHSNESLATFFSSSQHKRAVHCLRFKDRLRKATTLKCARSYHSFRPARVTVAVRFLPRHWKCDERRYAQRVIMLVQWLLRYWNLYTGMEAYGTVMSMDTWRFVRRKRKAIDVPSRKSCLLKIRYDPNCLSWDLCLGGSRSKNGTRRCLQTER